MIIIAFLLGVLTALWTLVWLDKKEESTPELIDYCAETQQMRVKHADGTVKEYVGSSTVWYHYPDFKRCTVSETRILADLHAKWRYERLRQSK